MSVPVRAPYYYGEISYFDDLEWAATELYIATKDKQYLRDAIRYAHQAGDNPWMGTDHHGHYEFFPYVNLAHWRLHPYVDAATQAKLAGYYRAGLERVHERAAKNPYRLGTPLVWCSTNDVVALATQAALYEQMTGDTRYRELATEARDWIFGRNPWGVSMVIGVPANGRHASRPHHLFYKLRTACPWAVSSTAPSPNRSTTASSSTLSTTKSSSISNPTCAVYHDQFADFSTNEPIIDGTVSLLLLLHVWAADSPTSETSTANPKARSSAATLPKRSSALFTGDTYANSAVPILDTLNERNIEAGFFLTGNFARNPAFRPALDRMLAEGHYFGPTPIRIRSTATGATATRRWSPKSFSSMTWTPISPPCERSVRSSRASPCSSFRRMSGTTATRPRGARNWA